MLELNGVHAHYGKVHVLQGTSLEVHNGEAVSLLGRNGVGKTTTLKTIMGLVPATGGEIVFDGRGLTDLAPHRIPETGIGYVPQGRGIFPTLSVKENLEIALTKAPPSQVTDYVFDRFPRLKERLGQPGGTLSGGEQQMLAMARILRTGARLLLLDEITEGLAPVIVEKLGEVLIALKNKGLTIVLVEQNFHFAAPLADRHYVVEHGQIVEEISANELSAKQSVLDGYLGV